MPIIYLFRLLRRRASFISRPVGGAIIGFGVSCCFTLRVLACLLGLHERSVKSCFYLEVLFYPCVWCFILISEQVFVL